MKPFGANLAVIVTIFLYTINAVSGANVPDEDYDEEPASTWEPTSRGRAALLAQSSQPFDLRENPNAMTGGSSSYREKSERRRRSPSTRRHKTGKEPPYKRYR